MNKRWKLTFLISLLFSLSALVFAADGDKSVISIESAQKTEYKKDAVTGADTIVLTGGVRISVTRGSTKTIIFADVVNYNRETDMIYAEGSVKLEQTGSKAGGESVTAKSLLFNTATLEGIFDNGRVVQTQSDALNLPSGSTLNVASTIFGRDSGGTIAFKNGELTFCDDEDPHWKIRARRIWLLPGGEFAFFSALLYVGHVPLLYFPAFYYPKDELIFNPAFGYRNREGYYINNTFYIIGRKPQNAKSTAETNKAGSSSSSSSEDKINFFSLMKTNGLKEQRREGLVMHNLDENYSGDTSKYLKLMADYYANLGVMVGLSGVFKPNDVITTLEGGLQLGWSNTIFKKGTTYLPYAESGEKYSDSSNFMGIKTPFRYMGNFKLAIAKPFPITFSMPMYSDPYFNYDFNNRAETMDWIDFLMSSPSENTDEASISEDSRFTWQFSGSYTFKLPEVLSPFVSSFSISSFSSSLEFASKENATLSKTDSYSTYSPERKFYYPSQIKPFESSFRVSGTIFQYPLKEKTAAKGTISVSLLPPKEFDTSEKKDEGKDDAEK
ncbi:MAG: LPS-assembly protein LptD, partial [Treponema sp.]|nr:LPS-assembly protein LptD [Treponema sp.]